MANRVAKILNHLQKTDGLSSNLKNTFKETIIDDVYHIRLMRSSDYESVFEMCQNTFGGGNDYVHRTFYRILNDNKCMFFCCEHIPTKKVIGCDITKIMDNGHTGFGFGSRIHPDFRSKKIFTKFSSYVAKWRKQNLKGLRIRGTTLATNEAAMHIYGKTYGSVTDILYRFIYVTQGSIDDIKFYAVKNTASAINENVFEKKLKQYGCHKYNDNLKEINNVGLIIDLLHKYGKKELHLDWKIYDITIDDESEKECYNYLYNEWNDGRLKMYTCNSNNDAFGLLYKDERKKLECFLYIW